MRTKTYTKEAWTLLGDDGEPLCNPNSAVPGTPIVYGLREDAERKAGMLGFGKVVKVDVVLVLAEVVEGGT